MKPVIVRRCTNHFPAAKAPEATHQVGARCYCRECALRMLAFVEAVKAATVVEVEQ